MTLLHSNEASPEDATLLAMEDFLRIECWLFDVYSPLSFYNVASYILNVTLRLRFEKSLPTGKEIQGKELFSYPSSSS